MDDTRHQVKIIISKIDGEVLDHMTLVDDNEHETVEQFAKSVAGVLTDYYAEADE